MGTPMDELRRRNGIAAEAVLPLARAVRPVFIASYPDPVGSCVLLNINGQVFLLSAAHVLARHKEAGLLLGYGTGTDLFPLNGEVYNSARGPSGTHDDDRIDASVLRLTERVPPELVAACLSWEDLDLDIEPETERFLHVVVGFRLKTTRVTPSEVRSRGDRYVSIEWKDDVYRAWDYPRRNHVLMCFDKELDVEGEIRRTPSPRGISGGAIFKIHNLSGEPGHKVPTNVRVTPKLSAIFTEAREEEPGKKPILVGTRVWIHMRLIATYFPQAFAE